MENSNTNSSLPIPEEDDILAFIIAIKSGSVEKMKEMLDKYKTNISNKLESQLRQPPLYFAVVNADEELGYEMSKYLIDAGSNPHFKDANEQTALFYCCRDGKRKLLEELIKAGVKLDDEDLYGQTPIFYVASENRLNLLDLFSPESTISINLVVNHVDKLAQQTALFYAARKGHLDMCKALIEKGANVNQTDTYEKTAIEYARKSKFQEVVDFLSVESKKLKEMNKSQSCLIQESSQNEANRKKKKDNVALNMNKNNYKISVLKENMEVHDLTEEEVKELCKSIPNLEEYLSNPDSIPQELLEETTADSWEKSAIKVMNIIWKMKQSHWFYEPVNPIRFGITDYFDIITKPIDLGTIKKKLNYNSYNNANEFADDVRQVFKNSYTYNGEHHEVSVCAKEIEVAFEEAIKAQGLTKFL